MLLDDHGLLNDPKIAKLYAQAVANKDEQIAAAVANPPFESEQAALLERAGASAEKGVLDDDIDAFAKFNEGQNLEFLRHRANLADNESKIAELHGYIVDKWQNTLAEKIAIWKKQRTQGLEDDFFVRMQAWFDALLKARELAQISPELFGEDGLMMDAVSLVNDALDTSDLGDEKVQNAMLKALSSLSDITMGDSGEIPANGYKGQNRSKKLSLAQILKHFNKIKNNEPLMKLCEMLGRLREARDEVFMEKIKEQTAYSYTQSVPTKRTKEEICGVELGADLANLIPQEFSLLNDDDLEILFDLKLLEKRLFCFEKQGLVEKQIKDVKEIEKQKPKEQKSKDKNKGAIILCVDTSGSMSGEPEMVTKALTLFVASRARRKNRACYLINFSSDIKCEDLSEHGWGERLNSFLRLSFGGGTDVGKALEKGVEMMGKDEFEKSDLLVISDGDFGEVSQRIVGKMDKQREQENRFFLLDITEKSKALDYFDKHFLYDGKNVKVLGELASEIR
ncbi:MAG: VWA domain-containing protein [Campylobacter sp.]|uniref:VWA domain-containing protein n=1 Tax=Campylobacter sp. TaxID=205 RepID=UPI002AA738B8|nr:VWA domain-containing protein [Campylobacter sp.]MCI7549542.1 VWA domain-containing protein [Campylobacter sp.]